jgi:phosphatidylserine/phosphatidylglycerophosphate/cardiolipin synthase-like enzyme
VSVRVLLDSAYEGEKVNAPAFAYLKGHGVDVRWAPRGYIFHIKVVSFDHRVSDISSGNLEAKYYARTRDAAIIDRNVVQVRAIERTFANDWGAAPGGQPSTQTVQAPGLVWSPNTGTGTAEAALVAQIRGAHHAVDFSSEELADPDIYGALALDAEHGVTCRVLMTRSSEWEAAFDQLSRAGCQVHTFPDSSTALYIHEKLIIDDPGGDDAAMLLGSQNASETSLTRNRELGIVLTAADGGAAPISEASATFNSDFARATPWTTSAAASTPTNAPTTPRPAGCHPLSSGGNCYEPGEYCSDADHGTDGTAGDGKPIACEDEDGWRWEPR